jgi:hypothetical protein
MVDDEDVDVDVDVCLDDLVVHFSQSILYQSNYLHIGSGNFETGRSHKITHVLLSQQ